MKIASILFSTLLISTLTSCGGSETSQVKNSNLANEPETEVVKEARPIDKFFGKYALNSQARNSSLCPQELEINLSDNGRLIEFVNPANEKDLTADIRIEAGKLIRVLDSETNATRVDKSGNILISETSDYDNTIVEYDEEASNAWIAVEDSLRKATSHSYLLKVTHETENQFRLFLEEKSIGGLRTPYRQFCTFFKK